MTNTKLWKPMLAAKPDPEELDAILATLTYPLLGSPKLDGIRCTIQNGRLYSRSLKLIPNLEMQKLWGKKEYNDLDGEIIVGPATAPDCFNRSTSIVMSRNKPATDATYNVFDCFDKMLATQLFAERLENAYDAQDCDPYTGSNRIVQVPHVELKNPKQLLAYEEKMAKLGHEGIMLRDPEGVYKHGRSTLTEGGLIAVKRFVDAEAVILDTYEQEANTNAKVDGKRTSHKAGKIGKDTLGGFTVMVWEHGAKSAAQGVFNIGTGIGLTDDHRKALWLIRKQLPGKIIKFRYQKVGTKTAPRIPSFLGFRSKDDL
jgi:DNA ligase 1